MLVRLNSDRGTVMVNSDHVVSVTQDFHGRMLLVKTVDGEVHEVYPRYGQTIWQAQDDVFAALKGGNDAT